MCLSYTDKKTRKPKVGYKIFRKNWLGRFIPPVMGGKLGMRTYKWYEAKHRGVAWKSSGFHFFKTIADARQYARGQEWNLWEWKSPYKICYIEVDDVVASGYEFIQIKNGVRSWREERVDVFVARKMKIFHER